MELPKKAAKLFADNAKLQKMAYNMMVEICKGHGGKFRFSSDLCIDLDYGVIGVTTCNLKGMYLKDDYLLVELVPFVVAGDRLCKIYTICFHTLNY